MRTRQSNGLLLFMASFCLIMACVVASLFFLKTNTDNTSLTVAHALSEELQLPNAVFDKTNSVPDDMLDQFDGMTEGQLDEYLLRRIDFNNLKAVNKDVRSWVYIPDTNIDYYVMQEQELGVYYYLWRDIYKNSSSWGSILTPKIPLNADDAHLLIFGHRMKNTNTAFSSLSKFRDAGYGAEHKYVYQYYPDHAERWRVWAVMNVQPNDDVYNMPYTLGSDEYGELLGSIAGKAIWSDSSVKPDSSVRVTALSTCHDNDTRFVVVCVPDLAYYY